MKRYLLFAGANYYPRGGMEDFVAGFDGLDGAIARGRAETDHSGERRGKADDWWHVLDLEEGKVVADGSFGAVHQS